MVMQRYSNLNGESGVAAFEIGADYIIVQFANGDAYRYDIASTGRANVETMKKLARAGRGLSTFISQHVRNRYAERVSSRISS